ncbi:MFS transporter [Micromonospora sp. Llam7]|uniref:MFS transporter n=1 Tax=Micromonospora tarapacensis TaxID=2835305 RepID=UPI001C82CDAF|nr:MFS transporter [Micromonospora tarapacensis]MBX7267356.1 MFS transporter [Micromonospora tarapacensis]
MAEIKTRDEVSYRKITFFIALALFAQESTWNFYDNQVPVLLREHVTSAALVGVLMGMDNLLGIFIQPWIGNRSDNTRTRWGRRIPYLAVGMPLGALIFLLLPWTTSLVTLVAVMVCYALVANTMRPLAEALTPDFVPPQRRGRTNAVVKIATSLTIIVASLISLLVVDDHPRAAFVIPAAIMLAVTAVMIAKVRDSRSPAYRAAVTEDATTGPGETRSPLWRVITELVTSRDRRRVLLLLTVFLFGGAWFASRSLMTPYGMEVLGLTRGEAGGLTLPSGVAYLIAAYPAALAAERFGRLRVVLIGIAVFAAALTAAAVVRTPTGTVVLFCVAAMGAAGFLINAAVALWNLAPSSRMLGAYTGLYAVTWYLGGFAGPALVGVAVDLVGWDWMLLDIAVLATLAAVVVIRLARLEQARETTPAPAR